MKCCKYHSLFRDLLVKRMDVLRAVIVLFYTLCVVFLSTTQADGSDDEHDVDAFHSIMETLKVNESVGLTIQNLTALLKKLEVHDCSEGAKHHHKCITAKTLYEFYNISQTSTLKEDDFAKMAPVIVYSLLPNEEEHHEEHGEGEDEDRNITKNVEVYDELLKRYSTRQLCEQIVDQVLKDVNESIGHQLNMGKCFSSHDVVHDLNTSSENVITKGNLPELSTNIVSKLLEEHCIEVEHKTPLPCPSFFVDELFEEYAEDGTIKKENMKKLLETLNIGRPESSDHAEEQETGHGAHDHRRRRRRSLPERSHRDAATARRTRRDAHEHEHEEEHSAERYKKCYSVDELYAIYHVNESAGVNVDKFQRFSPALIHQIESKVCVAKTHKDSDDVEDKYVWGYGFLAVLIISLCSVVGVAIIPLSTRSVYQMVVVFLISLAVGTLAGDALLHLLPHATGAHDDAHDHGSGHDEEEDKSYLWKFLVALAGIYGFFLFENLTRLFFRKSIDHSHSVEHTRRHSQFADGVHSHENPALEMDDTRKEPVVLKNMRTNVNENGSKNKAMELSNGYAEEKSAVKKPIASVAWMIIIGDTVHNIADGIAIGVAFAGSVSGGVSTSIAVFCHELPHELGDFAVLLSAGMSVKQALIANFLSACSCFIGLIFGILIGEVDSANNWIFAATAGFFLYIALTDMLPELMHSSEFNKVSNHVKFLLQNAGMLTGFAIMLLLAYYEEDIHV